MRGKILFCNKVFYSVLDPLDPELFGHLDPDPEKMDSDQEKLNIGQNQGKILLHFSVGNCKT